MGYGQVDDKNEYPQLSVGSIVGYLWWKTRYKNVGSHYYGLFVFLLFYYFYFYVFSEVLLSSSTKDIRKVFAEFMGHWLLILFLDFPLWPPRSTP